MKAGDKVKVIGLLDIDKKDTNLQIGDVGVVEEVEDNGIQNVNMVRFCDNFICDEACENLTKDGLYSMFDDQIELIEDEV